MKTYSALAQFNKDIGPVALAIGNFDGVHCGHQKLISEITTHTDVQSVILSFEPHPITIVNPAFPYKRLFLPRDQEEQFANLGVSHLIKLKFDKAMSQMNYDDFLLWIYTYLNIKQIVVGYDFKFGRNKEGTFENLRNWCLTRKIDFVKVEEVRIDSRTVSTTEIKNLLQIPQIDLVNKMLGRQYYLEGVVIKGDQRGRLLGFPTANTSIATELQIPAHGVYGTEVVFEGKRYSAITNIGKTPTFKSDEVVKIETHILDFNKEIYGSTLRVEFKKYIRKEMKFSSVEDIKIQIKKDILESLNG